MSHTRAISPFIFDEHFSLDPRLVLLVVYFKSQTEICVYMPQHIAENISDTFSDDAMAAIKDFLENVPRTRKAV